MEMGSGDESNGVGMPVGTVTGKCLWSSSEIFYINNHGKSIYTHAKLRLDIGNNFFFVGRKTLFV
jgi:hypothetical protein